MSIEQVVQGGLFTRDYLEYAICDDPDWPDVDPERLAAELRPIFERFLEASEPNESQTEEDLIWPVLKALGWTDYLRQQSLSGNGTQGVPDGLLFLDEAAKNQANRHSDQWRRYEYGAAVVVSGPWTRSLDGISMYTKGRIAPSIQMLRHLRLIDNRTNGGPRWGILTNGRQWRLYLKGAQSASEQFFHIDLKAVLDASTFDDGDAAKAVIGKNRMHWLQVFGLMYRKEAFVLSKQDQKSFHLRALKQSRCYRERVVRHLSKTVLENVLPTLVGGLFQESPGSSNQELRESAYILLYRLQFLFYAEDSNMLPMWNDKYLENSLRNRVRDEVGRCLDGSDSMSSSSTRFWTAIMDLFRTIEAGNSAMGVPPYGEGLFGWARAPLLAKVRLGDDLVSNIIDALSYDKSAGKRRYINYGDLSVQSLGLMFERLLELDVQTESGDDATLMPSIVARKFADSYYTTDDFALHVIRKTLGPQVQKRFQAFEKCVDEVSTSEVIIEDAMATISDVDPAAAILELKVCDPEMRSGNFLLNTIDYLTDTVIDAIEDARILAESKGYEFYESPLIFDLRRSRTMIASHVRKESIFPDYARLTDRHIIRRTILTRCIHGIDRDEMAVELVKILLWMHTFTAHVPPLYIDHKVCCGNGLPGKWIESVMGRLGPHVEKRQLKRSLQNAWESARWARTVACAADLDVAGIEYTSVLHREIAKHTDPINSLMSILSMLERLDLYDTGSIEALDSWLDGQFGDPIKIAQGQQIPMLPACRMRQIRERINEYPEFLLGPTADRADPINV